MESSSKYLYTQTSFTYHNIFSDYFKFILTVLLSLVILFHFVYYEIDNHIIALIKERGL